MIHISLSLSLSLKTLMMTGNRAKRNRPFGIPNAE